MSMTTLPSAPPIAIRRRPEAALFMRMQLESPRRNLSSRRAPSATCIQMTHDFADNPGLVLDLALSLVKRGNPLAME